MIKVEASVIINKPVAEVYAYVTSGEHTTEWQGGVTSVENEGPPNKVGTRYTETRKFMGQDMKTTLEVAVVEPDVKWVSKVVKGPVPYEVTLLFEASGSGTRMTTKVDGEPTGFFKIAEGMVASQLEKSMGEDNERLKKLLEG